MIETEAEIIAAAAESALEDALRELTPRERHDAVLHILFDLAQANTRLRWWNLLLAASLGLTLFAEIMSVLGRLR